MDTTLSEAQLLLQKSLPLKAGQGLTEAQVNAYLAFMTDWSLKDGAIERSFAFENYYQTIAFVNALAWVVHAHDHHPDLMVSYNRCVARFNTHSVKGISLNDFICAAHANALYRDGAKGPD